MRIFQKYTYLDQLLVSAGNFFLSVLLANSLNPEIFGKYVLLWLGVQFVSSIQIALFVFPLLTNAPQKSSWIKEKYITAIAIQNRFFIVVSIISFYIYYQVINGFVENSDSHVISFLFPIAGGLFLIQDLHRRFSIIRGNRSYLLLSDLQAYAIPLIVLTVCSQLTKLTLITVFAVIAVTFLLSSAYSATRVKSHRIKGTYVALVAKKNWVQSKFLVGASILQLGGENIFLIIAGAMLGPSSTAVIRVLQNIMGACHVFFVSIETNLAIKSAELKREGDTRNFKRLLSGYLYCGATTFFIMFLVFAASEDQIFKMIYGDQYVGHSKYLKWFAVSYCFIFFTIILKVGLRTIGASHAILRSTVIVVILNVSVSASIISEFGLSGAVAGLVLSNCIYALLLASGIVKAGYENKN